MQPLPIVGTLKMHAEINCIIFDPKKIPTVLLNLNDTNKKLLEEQYLAKKEKKSKNDTTKNNLLANHCFCALN